MNTRTLLRGADLAIPVETLRRVVDDNSTAAFAAATSASARTRRHSQQLAQLAGGDRGALVASIEEGGPAATAGVLVGDILIELDGVAITGPDSLRAACSAIAQGRP
jgi:serine protease Do